MAEATARKQESPSISPVPAGVRSGSFSGLGISGAHNRTVSAESFPGPDVGTFERIAPSYVDPLLSPPPTNTLSNSTYIDSPYKNGSFTALPKPSPYSVSAYELQAVRDSSQTRLNPTTADTTYNNYAEIGTSKRRSSLRQRGWCSWISLSTIALTLYSTVFSGIFLAIAFRAPSYGRLISTNGKLTASNAAFLTSLFAKTIEMTFVTAMLAVLGQELSRRAYGKSRWVGVSIADMSMRSWIVQPGTLISRWESVRYAGITILGLLSLIATLVATLYTPAATALVQPQLKMIDWQLRDMQAVVKASFSNPLYVEQQCHTPISSQFDSLYYATTCVSLQMPASGYYDFYSYLGKWNATSKNSSTVPADRPKGTGLILETTVVESTWIENIDMVTAHKNSGLIINNVSLALPHSGIVAAARDAINDIMQPGELDGLGAYVVEAAVPSPVMHVLCVTLSRGNLRPLVYELWDDAELPVDLAKWPEQIAHIDPFLNTTRLDSLFGWGEAYGKMAVPPVFPKLPIDYNTILNTTNGMPWGRDSLYLLAKASPQDVNNASHFGDGQDYALCQLRVSQSANCSTRFTSAATGNTLTAHCEDDNDIMQYSKHLDTPPTILVEKDWPNIAFLWSTSLSLNDGWFAGNASIGRLLSQSILRNPQYIPNIPSIAESLAVMASNTLLIGAFDSPMVHFWNYTTEHGILNESVHQYFPARVRVQEYASGGTMSYHRAFFPVLFIMFLLNLIALVYLAFRREWLVDLSEPQTLLSLAVSTPAKTSPDTDDVVNNHKQWKTNPSGRDLNVGWAVKEYGTGVSIEQTPNLGGTSPLQGLRNRVSNQWGGRNNTPRPLRGTFQPINGS